ncbi:MAG TPA: ribosome biogenesis GTP-binding protein YihA/YsxC [Pyrinomonadaceae bacterium]|jgi:GTP-binding protein
MKITSAEFLKSAFEEKDWPREPLPEIAFLGRSNVGKSSLMNSLLGVRGLARTSSTPGRTQALNFFLINRRFRFVDLPGYGYARVPKKIRESWGEIVTDYLAKRDLLVLSIQIVDSRHAPTSQDLQLNDWLAQQGHPRVIVATKSDKLSNNELSKSMERARQALGTARVFAYSALTGRGRNEVWRIIEDSINRSMDDQRQQTLARA